MWTHPTGEPAQSPGHPQRRSRRVVGWRLEAEDRARLLLRFPPHYPDVVADHVTLRAGAEPSARPPPEIHDAVLIGRADDGEGVEAMVVRLAGDTVRPEGGVFHITWSLDRSRRRRAVESNHVIAERGWRALPEPVPVRLLPRIWLP